MSGLGTGGIAQPEATVTVVIITAAAPDGQVGWEREWRDQGRSAGKPQQIPQSLETGPTSVCTFIPGSTGEAPGLEDRVPTGSAAPPGSSLSWPPADRPGPPSGPLGAQQVASPQDAKMESPRGTQCHFSQGLLLSGKEEMRPRRPGEQVSLSPGVGFPLGRRKAIGEDESIREGRKGEEQSHNPITTLSVEFSRILGPRRQECICVSGSLLHPQRLDIEGILDISCIIGILA